MYSIAQETASGQQSFLIVPGMGPINAGARKAQESTRVSGDGGAGRILGGNR